MTPRLRLARDAPQQVWIVFGGDADQPWLRPLRRGFRHCFAALRDEAGWTVLEPLSGRLMVMRLAVVGPFAPGAPRAAWLPALLPLNCVGLCRAVLGAGAPRAVTPWGLFRRLAKILAGNKKNVLQAALN